MTPGMQPAAMTDPATPIKAASQTGDSAPEAAWVAEWETAADS